MSALEQQPTPLAEVVAQVRSDEFRQQIASALPGNVTPDRFVRVTVTALRENPDVLNADRSSLFSAVVRCAQDGLLPDNREAALVVFGQKVAYLPMIGGFRKIAAEHGWAIRTQVVHEADEFEYELGLEPRLVHRPAPLNAARGELIGAYAVATHKDGRKQLEVLTGDEIRKVRDSSRARNSGPWRDWTERMWEKTAGRRLFAKLPLGERDEELIARVLEASRPLEPGEAQTMLYGPPRPARALPASPVAAGPASPPDQGETHHGSDAEAKAAAGTAPVAGDQQAEGTDAAPAPSASGPDFEGEEPPDVAPAPNETTEFAVPTFTSGKHMGRQLVDIYSDGASGIAYLKWARRHWNTEPLKTALAAFAQEHPEIEP